jgi:hypothetical protein
MPQEYSAGLNFPEDVMTTVLCSKTLKLLESKQSGKKTKQAAAQPAVS